MNTDRTLLAQILSRSYKVTPPELMHLAERIREIEGVYVNLDFKRPAKSNSDYNAGRYDYERAASGKMNAGRWAEKRFCPKFPFLRATLTTTEGRRLLDDELLSYARGSCSYRTHISLRFFVESTKETPEEMDKDLKKLKRNLASFPIFTSRELTYEANKFLFFKWHNNHLILMTKQICLREYEFQALKEILSEIIVSSGYDVDCSEESHDYDTKLSDMFTSKDLNSLIPLKKEAFSRNALSFHC